MSSPAWADCVPFVPPITGGYAIKVYDGDTFTLAAKLPYDASPLYRFSVRLNGIDTPEIKGKAPEEREAAKRAKAALESLILNKAVELRNVATEKYGRVLADVHIDGVHVNAWMLAQGFAVAYDGGTKADFMPIHDA